MLGMPARRPCPLVAGRAFFYQLRKSEITIKITGVKELDRKFKRLANKASKKVEAQGIRAGLRVIVKGIKSEIPPHMKDARKAIGSRFKRRKSGEVKAIAGGGAGKKKAAQAGERSGKPGVGISAMNIHWFLLGTTDRTQKTTGRRTGVMPAVDAVRRGFAKTEAAARAKITDTIRKGIAREAKKK